MKQINLMPKNEHKTQEERIAYIKYDKTWIPYTVFWFMFFLTIIVAMLAFN